MGFSVMEALWVRLVDVGAALSARRLGDGELVLDVQDELCPWNEGELARRRRGHREDEALRRTCGST